MNAKLKESALYLGDNGRITCGSLRCAGMTAHFSGADLSGQPMEALSVSDVRYLQSAGVADVKCESCKRPFTFVATVGGVR